MLRTIYLRSDDVIDQVPKQLAPHIINKLPTPQDWTISNAKRLKKIDDPHPPIKRRVGYVWIVKKTSQGQ